MADTKKVVIHQSNIPKGDPVEVLHLGVFSNGSTNALSEEQVANYEAQTGADFPKSGYVIVGEANSKEAKEAQAANEKAKVVQVSNQPEVAEPTPEQVKASQEFISPANSVIAAEQANKRVV